MKKVYKIIGGYGYIVEVGGCKIKQEHKPAYSGNILMTQEETEKLSELVEQKMLQELSPTVTIEEMEALWDGTKNYQKIIDEEKEWIATHSPQPPDLP